MNDESRVFLDSNIIVYALTDSADRRHDKARTLLRSLAESGTACLSTQVLQEVFVTLTRKAGVPAEQALADISDLGEWPLFAVDRTAVIDAARLSLTAQVSFWDALILTAAKRLGAETLLTEDLQHGQVISGVRIQNPF